MAGLDAGFFLFDEGDGGSGFGDLEAEVADVSEGDVFEVGVFGGEGFEDAFEGGGGGVVIVESLEEVGEEFPVLSGISGREDGLVGALEATGDVDVGGSFFGETGSGEDDVGSHGGGVGEDMGGGEEFEVAEVFGFEFSFFEEVFLEDEEGFDAFRRDAFADGVELGGGVVGAKNEGCSGGVGIAVGGDEFAVGGGVARDGGDEVGAEVVGDFFDEVEFFVGEAGGGDDGDLVGLAHLEAFGDGGDGFFPGGLGVLPVFFQKGVGEAFVGVEVVEVEPVGVGHPG